MTLSYLAIVFCKDCSHFDLKNRSCEWHVAKPFKRAERCRTFEPREAADAA